MARLFQRPRPRRAGADELIRCARCGSDFVSPVDWAEHDETSWWIRLRCGECGETREVVVSQEIADRYDRALDRRSERDRLHAEPPGARADGRRRRGVRDGAAPRPPRRRPTSAPLADVEVTPLRPQRFAEVLAGDGFARFEQTIATAHALLGTRTVWNVNSTAYGGGVAEMLRSLIG